MGVANTRSGRFLLIKYSSMRTGCVFAVCAVATPERVLPIGVLNRTRTAYWGTAAGRLPEKMFPDRVKCNQTVFFTSGQAVQEVCTCLLEPRVCMA